MACSNINIVSTNIASTPCSSCSSFLTVTRYRYHQYAPANILIPYTVVLFLASFQPDHACIRPVSAYFCQS